jgi:citrate lyase beta subunit
MSTIRSILFAPAKVPDLIRKLPRFGADLVALYAKTHGLSVLDQGVVAIDDDERFPLECSGCRARRLRDETALIGRRVSQSPQGWRL